MGRRERQNFIIGIVAAVGIILIVAALWFVRKEHRYKTYKNYDKNFSIQYPVAWSFQENKNGAEVIFYSPVENELDVFQENVNIVVQDISANPMSLEKYTKIAIEQMEVVFGEYLITQVSEPTSLAKQSAYMYIFVGKGPGSDMKYMSAWLIKDLKSYQLTYTSLASQYDRFFPKVKKMFKSFRVD